MAVHARRLIFMALKYGVIYAALRRAFKTKYIKNVRGVRLITAHVHVLGELSVFY